MVLFSNIIIGRCTVAVSLEQLTQWIGKWATRTRVTNGGIQYHFLTNRGEFPAIITKEHGGNYVLLTCKYVGGDSQTLDDIPDSRKLLNDIEFGEFGKVVEQDGFIFIQAYYLLYGKDHEHDETHLLDCYYSIKSTWKRLDEFFEELKH